MDREKIDIHERIFKFVVDVLKICNKLPRTSVNQAVICQLISSVTSVGANDQEADGAITRKDFINKYSIVRKEAKETRFWLRVVSKMNPRYNPEATTYLKENLEIIKIVSQIIYNTQQTNKPINKYANISNNQIIK